MCTEPPDGHFSLIHKFDFVHFATDFRSPLASMDSYGYTVHKKDRLFFNEVTAMRKSKQQNTQDISHAAIALFREKGYEKVSVNDICAAAGVARSVFYSIFSCKREIIDRLLEQVRTDESDLTTDLMTVGNDFERMWGICSRYLDIALEFGPKLSASLLQLELAGELSIYTLVHLCDDWMIQLTRNCQAADIILNRNDPENLGPFGVDAVYMVFYQWCMQNGAFSLKERARIISEETYELAPQFRWTWKQLSEL